jgi:hypothetical protein
MLRLARRVQVRRLDEGPLAYRHAERTGVIEQQLVEPGPGHLVGEARMRHTELVLPAAPAKQRADLTGKVRPLDLLGHAEVVEQWHAHRQQ